MTGIQAVKRDYEEQLPLARCWRVERQYALDTGAEALTSELSMLAGDDAHYWVLQQGPLAPGSKRQSLLNLDSDLALASALGQTFRGDDSPQSLVFQCMPPQRAAGVLFSRHPMRPDLEHIVVEGCLNGSSSQERLILHADGRMAWHSADADDFLDEVGTECFHELARNLDASFGEPRAAEWIWDGQRLWLVQALPIGTLPEPSEVWTRRAGLGFVTQAISPLWYTMFGRWLKEGFWRRIGTRAGWRELGNVEPYRRQHSYLYGNSRFFRALQGWLGGNFLDWALPPGWRSPESRPVSDVTGRMRRLWLAMRLKYLRWQLSKLEPASTSHEPDELWLALIRLDKLGEALAWVEGWLGYVVAPTRQKRGDPPAGMMDAANAAAIATLANAAREPESWQTAIKQLAQFSAGADPAFPRFEETPPDLESLQALLSGLSPERLESMTRLGVVRTDPWLTMRWEASQIRHQLASSVRQLLRIMARRLVARRLIRHPDDIFFLYFDELWQAWQGQARKQLDTLLGERKVRYLSDAHAGPPDWIIDSIGYGTSPLGQTSAHETVRGYPLVSGKVQGAVQRLGSGWQLNQVQAGAILVLDQSDPGWLPWVATASGVVMAHRDPLDPAAALVQALGIPAVWGVDDAMHCLPDGVEIELDGDSGHLRQLPQV